MIRTVFALATGFLLARQIHIKHDREEAKRKEREAVQKLGKLLNDNGISIDEAKSEIKKIFDTKK